MASNRGFLCIQFQNLTAIVCLFAILIAIFLIYSIQMKLRFTEFNLSIFIKTSEMIIRSFLAIPNGRKIRFLRMRLAFGFWLIGCIFITAHIQTNFIAILTSPGYETEISTPQEVLNSKLIKTSGTM